MKTRWLTLPLRVMGSLSIIASVVSGCGGKTGLMVEEMKDRVVLVVIGFVDFVANVRNVVFVVLTFCF